MVGTRAVHVRGYQIMQSASDHDGENDRARVEEWMRQLRRTLFSLAQCGEDDCVGAPHTSGQGKDGGGQNLGDMGTGGAEHVQFLSSLRAEFADFQLDWAEGSSASSSTYSPSSGLPPILCTLARSTDMTAMAAAAAWLANERPKPKTTDTVDDQKDENLTTGQSSGRASKCLEREKDDVKEQKTVAEKDIERASKRLSRRVSGSHKNRDLSASEEKTACNLGAKSVETATSMPIEKEHRQTLLHNGARWGLGGGGGNVSDKIALCLVHRKAIQSSVSPICQKLLQNFLFKLPALEASAADGGDGVGTLVAAESIKERSHDVRLEQPAKNPEEKEVCKTTTNGSHQAMQEETHLGHDEEAVRRRLGDAEEQMAVLHQKLAAQGQRILQQSKLVHQLQNTQDLDTARACTLMQPPPCSSARDASDLSASLTRSQTLLSCLRIYVEPAALRLRLHAARGLCHSANEARVLVAMLLSEQAQLRQRLESLRSIILPAAEAAYTTTACAGAAATSSEAPALGTTPNQEPSASASLTVPPTSAPPVSEPHAAASSTENPSVVDSNAPVSHLHMRGCQDMEPLEEQLENNAALVLEMATAGLTCVALGLLCVHVHAALMSSISCRLRPVICKLTYTLRIFLHEEYEN